MRFVFATGVAVAALSMATAAAAGPPAPVRVVYNGPATVTQRCQAIAMEYRDLRARGMLRGEVRRDVLQRFHRTGCFGESMIITSPVEGFTSRAR